METQFAGKLNVQAAGDSFGCCITGLVVVNSSEIVLADYYNNSVKIVNVGRLSTDAITWTYKLSGAPWDVTAIDSVTAATTLPEKGQIVFVNTKTRQSDRDSLEIGKGCWGIDHNNGVFAVSFSKPSAVQILDMKGNVLHKFSVQGLFNSQSYISLSNDNKSIFLSENENHAVHQLTTDGHLMVEIKCGDLKFPAGLMLMRTGSVVVCGTGNSDRVTVIMPGTGELIVPLLVNDVHKPCCISVCEERNKMYISEDTTSVDRNYIKVYNLKH